MLRVEQISDPGNDAHQTVYESLNNGCHNRKTRKLYGYYKAYRFCRGYILLDKD